MGCYYINDGKRRELTESILEMIRTAKGYIKISSFVMEDQMVVDELRSVAYSGKVAVFVISNRNKREDEEYISTKDKKGIVDAEGIHAHRMFLQKMYYSGVHVRLLDNLHAKFIITDGQKGVLMSANIASNSLNKNVETGITVEGDDLNSLELVFDTMYNYADIVQFVQSDRSDVIKMSVKKLPNQIFDGIKGNIRLTAISRYQTNLSVFRPSARRSLEEYHQYAVQSISDWKTKYLDNCDACALKEKCCGLFATSKSVFMGLHTCP